MIRAERFLNATTARATLSPPRPSTSPQASQDGSDKYAALFQAVSELSVDNICSPSKLREALFQRDPSAKPRKLTRGQIRRRIYSAEEDGVPVEWIKLEGVAAIRIKTNASPETMVPEYEDFALEEGERVNVSFADTLCPLTSSHLL